MLLGQTAEGMQVWDVRRAVQALREIPATKDLPLALEGQGQMAGIALYASLFQPAVTQLELRDLPRTHMQGPHFLNVLRVLDMPAALAMAADGRKVTVCQSSTEGWDFAVEIARRLEWPADRLAIRPSP